MEIINVKKEINGKTLKLESGYLAKQANGAALVSLEETSVLSTVVMSKEAKEGDFFPLSVHYTEKSYAAGKIPGSFHKREGKPSDQEILTCRLIDRPIRPLFEKGFRNEVQIVPTVLNFDGINYPDVIGIIAASTSLLISDIPFLHPIGAVRIGFINNEFVVNPTIEEMKSSKLELLIAGTQKAITMIEGDAHELKEEQILKAVEIAHKSIIEIAKLQLEFQKKINKKKVEVKLFKPTDDLLKKVTESYKTSLENALNEKDKLKREESVKSIYDQAKEAFTKTEETEMIPIVFSVLHDLEKEIIRKWILEDDRRIDNRKLDEIRGLDCKINVLKNVHGSAVFTRGQTQALVVVTLGASKDQLKLDTLEGIKMKDFYLHYNFPPSSVGEVGRVGAPGRREIGHGFLAEKSIKNLVKKGDDFPYTIRIVSEILESNGSSSMASVCGTSLALMAAGVPIKKTVAGIALGLVMQDKKYKILTDIQGIEDGLGDMDFKIAGTKDGITGFQLDIKIEGITIEIMKKALEQAKKARLEIIKTMEKTISKPADDLSFLAPQYKRINVPSDRVKNLIGPGGKNIKSIIEETGSDIEINDDASVNIFSPSQEIMEQTIQLIESQTGSPQVGTTYNGTVKKITNYGAFIEVIPGTDGLCHISEIAQERIDNVESYLSEGEQVRVKVIGIDEKGRISLSKKDAE